jgi:hypothetical protein
MKIVTEFLTEYSERESILDVVVQIFGNNTGKLKSDMKRRADEIQGRVLPCSSQSLLPYGLCKHTKFKISKSYLPIVLWACETCCLTPREEH